MSTSRINLINNPSFEVDLSTWSVINGAVLTRDTGTAFVGSASMKMVGTAPGAPTYGQSAQCTLGAALPTIAAGTVVTCMVALKGNVGGEQITLFPSTNAETLAPATFTITNAWKLYAVTRTTTVSCTAGAVNIGCTEAVNRTWWVDAVGMITGAGLYFDGSTAADGNYTYAWLGAANGSQSAATPVVLNSAWPLIDEAISFQTGPNSPMPAPYWCSIIGRTEGQSTSARGRQYELDQTQAGISSVTVRNDDGALDPGNAASPFYPQVTPYRAHRRRAQYPATINLLTPDQATAGFASGVSSALPKWVTGTGTITQTVHSGSWKYTATTALGFVGWSVIPGATYTGQVYTGGGSSSMTFTWIDASGNTISTSSGTTSIGTGLWGWTATAPANAIGGIFTIPAGMSCYNVQVEQSATASAWVSPGTWYDMITDYVDQWPQAWTDGGTYGVSNLQAVDAFGYLSQRKLLSPAYMELLALGPAFLYPLDEASGAARFVDLTNTVAPMTYTVSPIGAVNTATSGNTLQDTAPTGNGYLPLGVGGPVVTVDNPQGGTGTQVSLSPPTTTPNASLSRVIAFKVNTAPAATSQVVWRLGAAYALTVHDVGSGVLHAELLDPGGTAFNLGTVNVGDWHVFGFTYNSAGPQNVVAYLDGNTPVTTSGWVIGAGVADVLAGSYTATGPLFVSGFRGDVALFAGFPFVFTGTQWTTMYSTFRYGGSGLGTATSATRYADVLRWAGWAGSQAEDNFTTGQTVAYGPSIELHASADQAGTDAVSALQAVVDTENGAHYADGSGIVTLKARRARYNQTTPQVIFGDRPDLGEIPYTTTQFGLDATRLANDAAITQTSTSIATRVLDNTSIGTYGDVQLQRTVNSLDTLEINDAANYLVQRFKTPRQRLEGITVDVGAYPSAWPSVLGLELGEPVRVMRRPPNAPAIQFDGFVEQINWTLNDQGMASVQFQFSPVGLGQNLSQLTATRGPLNANVSAAGTSLVVNVPTDAGGNSPVQNGWTPTAITSLQIVDGANTEIVTVSAMTYAAQLVTCTISALAHAHAAGVTVAENPSGWTYNQFDAVALLDGTHALAY